MSDLSKKALEIAITQIGQTEKPLGSNWGHPIEDYLASVGITFQAAWCMAFVYWCFRQASNELHYISPLVKTGSVLYQWANIDPRYKFQTPQIGSIFIMDFGGGLGHCGIVEKIENGWLHTIDGNTNNDGSRNGVEVERKIRPTIKMKGYINI